MKDTAMRLTARSNCDRQQLAAHVSALVRTALESPSTFCGNGCEAVNGLPRSSVSAWPAAGPFDYPGHFIPGQLCQTSRAQRGLNESGTPRAPERSMPVAIAAPGTCPGLRRRFKSGQGCHLRLPNRKSLPATLKFRQAALHRRSALVVPKVGQHAPSLPCWLDENDPVAAAMRHWQGHVSPGWHDLLRQTLRKLLAVAGSGARRAALTSLGVFCHNTEFWLSLPAGADPVLLGIARKAQMRARWTCSECGCVARLREIGEECRATLCPRCAAPLLLKNDIWELQQSIGFLRGVNVPVVAQQIPTLLRPSFCLEAAGHPENHGPAGGGRMSPARFLAWAALWQAMGERIFSQPHTRQNAVWR